MLEPLLASAPQSRVLSFILASPERSFTASELKGRLRLRPATAAAALAQLARAGVLTSFRKSGQRYYIIDRRSKELADLRKALGRRPQRDALFGAILKLGEIRAAFLSGIFTGQPQLPVDLLLVGKVKLKKLDRFLAEYHKLTGVELNYSIMSPEEFRQRRDTFDRFIKDIFDYRHLTVVDTLAKRKKLTV